MYTDCQFRVYHLKHQNHTNFTKHCLQTLIHILHTYIHACMHLYMCITVKHCYWLLFTGPAEPVHFLNVYKDSLISASTTNRINVHSAFDSLVSISWNVFFTLMLINEVQPNLSNIGFRLTPGCTAVWVVDTCFKLSWQLVCDTSESVL